MEQAAAHPRTRGWVFLGLFALGIALWIVGSAEAFGSGSAASLSALCLGAILAGLFGFLAPSELFWNHSWGPRPEYQPSRIVACFLGIGIGLAIVSWGLSGVLGVAGSILLTVAGLVIAILAPVLLHPIRG
jgi:hypothetical protein